MKVDATSDEGKYNDAVAASDSKDEQTLNTEE